MKTKSQKATEKALAGIASASKAADMIAGLADAAANGSAEAAHRPTVRRVFGRVKGVPVGTHEDKHGRLVPTLHEFELRKARTVDGQEQPAGIYFHRKHSAKWLFVALDKLAEEEKRQAGERNALAAARREDQNQFVLFVPAERENQLKGNQ